MTSEEAILHLELLKIKNSNFKSFEFYSLIKKYREAHLEKMKFLKNQMFEEASKERDKEKNILNILQDNTNNLSLIIIFFPYLIREFIINEILKS